MSVFLTLILLTYSRHSGRQTYVFRPQQASCRINCCEPSYINYVFLRKYHNGRQNFWKPDRCRTYLIMSASPQPAGPSFLQLCGPALFPSSFRSRGRFSCVSFCSFHNRRNAHISFLGRGRRRRIGCPFSFLPTIVLLCASNFCLPSILPGQVCIL